MEPRRLQHVGQLDLTPSAAVVTAAEKLIQSASLVLGLSLFEEKFLGTALHLPQRANVLLVELGQVALVLIEEVGQRLQGAIESGLALSHELFLRLIELVHRFFQHLVRKTLKHRSEILQLFVVLLAQSIDVFTSVRQFGLTNRELRRELTQRLTGRLRMTLGDRPRERGAHHETDHCTQNCDHL